MFLALKELIGTDPGQGVSAQYEPWSELVDK